MYRYKLWFARKWSHDNNMKGGEFEELWIGWLPEELRGEAEHTRSERG